MADTNPNILFKRGLQANLPANGSAIDGAFYLTTDTNRLYAGIGTNIVDLNKYIRTFTTLGALESNWSNAQLGDFAYIQEGNILATYTTVNGTDKWVQINPDTNVDTSLSSATFTKESVKVNDTNTIEITLSLVEKDINGKVITDTDGNAKTITASFVLSSEDIASITTDIAVDLESSVTDGVATLKIGGTGADNTANADTVSIKSAGSVAITGNENEIIITGTDTKYDLLTQESDSQGIISLKDTNSAEDIVNIKGDDTWIKTSSDAAGNVNIVHAGPGTGSAITPTDSGENGVISKETPKFTAVVGVEADSKGHITGVKTTEFTLPDSNFTLGVTEVDMDGDPDTTEDIYTSQVLLKNAAGANIGVANIKTAFKATVDGTQITVNNGDVLGSFYSAGKIDEKLKAIDAMHYGGTVASSAELAEKVAAGVSIGDTYKASADFTLINGDQTISVSAGDIFIANGIEDDDGNLTNVTWDYIESGADTDTTYTLTSSNNKLVLGASTGGSSEIDVLDDGQWIEATAVDNKLTVVHREITQQDEKTTKAEPITAFTAVTDVKRDDAGHVTGIETTDYTIQDMSNKLNLDAETPGFSLTNAAGAVQQTVNFEDGKKIAVSGVVDESGKILTITADHEKLTTTSTKGDDQPVALDGNGIVTAITGVNVDEYGHISGYTTTDYKIGAETNTLYDLGVSSTGEGTSATLALTDSNGTADTVTITSTNLTLTSVAGTGESTKIGGSVNIDFVWGTF